MKINRLVIPKEVIIRKMVEIRLNSRSNRARTAMKLTLKSNAPPSSINSWTYTALAMGLLKTKSDSCLMAIRSKEAIHQSHLIWKMMIRSMCLRSRTEVVFLNFES